MKLKPSIIIAMIGMCFLTFNILLQSAYAIQIEEVNLESAIETALSENPALKAIREKVKVAQVQLDGIALFSNPELESELIGGSDAEQIFELTKTFELGGQRSHRKQIAKINLEKVNLILTEESQKLTKSVKHAFYQLVLVQEKLKLTKEIIKHNQQILDMARVQFEAGDISVTQVGLANIQLQSALRESATLESDLQLARLELNGLMGTSLDAALTAIGELPKEMSKDLDLDALKLHALVHRADLKSLRLNVKQTESTHRLAKAANIPDLSIGGIAERSLGSTGFGVKFSIPLPLFDWNRAEINAAKAQKQVDTIEITNSERQIIREVITAFVSLNAAQKNLKFYDDNLLKLLNENLTLTRSAYELGEAELLEVILIQSEFVKTRFAYLDALAAYHKAFAELEAAIGTSIGLVIE
ncbi:TolC family protein [Candidatus Poribacteria bacterium]|nr:TolC family protein [Candidatus Poribacteria bacterium]